MHIIVIGIRTCRNCSVHCTDPASLTVRIEAFGGEQVLELCSQRRKSSDRLWGPCLPLTQTSPQSGLRSRLHGAAPPHHVHVVLRHMCNLIFTVNFYKRFWVRPSSLRIHVNKEVPASKCILYVSLS